MLELTEGERETIYRQDIEISKVREEREKKVKSKEVIEAEAEFEALVECVQTVR